MSVYIIHCNICLTRKCFEERPVRSVSSDHFVLLCNSIEVSGSITYEKIQYDRNFYNYINIFIYVDFVSV